MAIHGRILEVFIQVPDSVLHIFNIYGFDSGQHRHSIANHTLQIELAQRINQLKSLPWFAGGDWNVHIHGIPSYADHFHHISTSCRDPQLVYHHPTSVDATGSTTVTDYLLCHPYSLPHITVEHGMSTQGFPGTCTYQ